MHINAIKQKNTRRTYYGTFLMAFITHHKIERKLNSNLFRCVILIAQSKTGNITKHVSYFMVISQRSL